MRVTLSKPSIENLREMSDQTFQELVARFAVAFADAFRPDKQINSIINAMDDARFLTPGYMNYITLGEAVSVDRTPLHVSTRVERRQN